MKRIKAKSGSGRLDQLIEEVAKMRQFLHQLSFCYEQLSAVVAAIADHVGLPVVKDEVEKNEVEKGTEDGSVGVDRVVDGDDGGNLEEMKK